MPDDDILKKFNQHVSTTETQAALESFKTFAPVIAGLAMSIYKASVDAGFDNQQAFILAKDYTIATIVAPKK